MTNKHLHMLLISKTSLLLLLLNSNCLNPFSSLFPIVCHFNCTLLSDIFLWWSLFFLTTTGSKTLSSKKCTNSSTSALVGTGGSHQLISFVPHAILTSNQQGKNHQCSCLLPELLHADDDKQKDYNHTETLEDLHSNYQLPPSLILTTIP